MSGEKKIFDCRRAGADIVHLGDPVLAGFIDAHRDEDWRAQRFPALSCKLFRAGIRIPFEYRLSHQFTQAQTGISGQHDETPGPQAVMVGSSCGCVQNLFDQSRVE